ncbi:unnamed protein product [Amaranthus hypochondriacus]
MNKIEGIYMLCHFLGLAISLNANIGEFDEYWQKSKFEAVKYFEDAYHPDSYNVTHHFNQQVHLHNKSMKNSKKTRRNLLGKIHMHTGPCRATNPIDACWRCQPNWAENRKRLADCSIGFGKGTTGGKAGRFYVVIDSSDNGFSFWGVK